MSTRLVVSRRALYKCLQCLHDGERSITSNDKVINLYMAMRMCNKGKMRKAGLCMIKDMEIDVNAVRENAGNVQPCPCVA